MKTLVFGSIESWFEAHRQAAWAIVLVLIPERQAKEVLGQVLLEFCAQAPSVPQEHWLTLLVRIAWHGAFCQFHSMGQALIAVADQESVLEFCTPGNDRGKAYTALLTGPSLSWSRKSQESGYCSVLQAPV